MSTYVYVHPGSDNKFYKAFIVSDDGIVEEPTGFISTSGSSMTGENACLHVKPLLPEVSTSEGKFALGSNEQEFSSLTLAAGVGINYSWTQDKKYFKYYVVPYPGSNAYYQYKSVVELEPPAGLTGAQLKEWFAEKSTYVGRSGRNYTSDHGWYKYPVSWVAWPPAVDSVTAVSIASSIHWTESLQLALDTMYYDAISELKFNMNNIANSMQIADLFKSFRSLNSLGKEITEMASEFVSKSTAKKLGDAWLQYRYAYLTTKSDVEEFVQKAVTNKAADTGVLHVGSSLDGFALNMKIAYKPIENKTLRSLSEFISMPKRLGLDPSLYNLWDMVPFSFIADWFVPIGDNLERISNQTWAKTMPYTTACLASYKGIVEYWGHEYLVYSRFDFHPSDKWSWISKDGTSLLTATKRGLDVLSLTRK